MKNRLKLKSGIVLILLLSCMVSTVFAENESGLDVMIGQRYKYRQDGEPGRETTILVENELSGLVKIELDCEGIKEVQEVTFAEPVHKISILLPAGVGVKKECEINLKISNSGNSWEKTAIVPAMRHWNILIYPHSHVDIGYTNTHANVEIIHTRNLVNGLELAKKTKDYPEGAKYIWNTEVIWPFDMYLKKATPGQRENVINGVKDGYLHLDAGYVNLNTSLAGDEELLEFFRLTKEYEKLTGKKIETLVQVDIPGMSWGIVTVAAKLGFKYCFTFNNGSDRVGRSTDHSFKPFWWADAQGKNKILYFQPSSYVPGAWAKGKYYWPEMAGQTDPSKLIEIVKTDHPRENFIDDYINRQLPELEESDYYPYDIFAMSWAMADNTPIDADLPEAVKSWNEEYAYPRLKIASATEIMRTFEEKYGDQLPVLKGDFTEYWTDGAGTAAKQTAQNRTSKERLVQAETFWTMLNPGKATPREKFNEAWRNIIMGSEHTWCYMNPKQEPINSDILKVKFNYFQKAFDQSHELLSLSIKPAQVEESVSFAVFNNLSWQHDGFVTIPACQAEGYYSVVEADGKKVPSQSLSTGEIIFEASGIPAFGSKKYSLKKKKTLAKEKLAQNNVLDNGIVRVEVDPTSGDVSSLKFEGVEFVDKDAECAINSYRYLKGDDDPERAFKPKNVRISIKENGPVMASLLIESEAEGAHGIASEISVFKGQSHIEFKNVVDKIKTTDKEGVHFGFAFDVDKPKVVADIPWGTMEIEKDQLHGANRNWIALQHWLTVSNDDRNITWCPMDAPVFQVGDMTANILGGATNSEKWIKKLEQSGTIYSWAINNHWHTNFQLSQGGKLVFRYRLQPGLHKRDDIAANRFAMEQYQPLVVVPVEKSFKANQLLEIEGNPAVYATVFKTDIDGKSAILRLRSLSDVDENVGLNWLSRKPSSVHLLDIEDDSLLEEVKDKVMVPAKDFVSLKVKW